ARSRVGARCCTGCGAPEAGEARPRANDEAPDAPRALPCCSGRRRASRRPRPDELTQQDDPAHVVRRVHGEELERVTPGEVVLLEAGVGRLQPARLLAALDGLGAGFEEAAHQLIPLLRVTGLSSRREVL